MRALIPADRLRQVGRLPLMTSIPGALLLITLTASLCPAQPADEGQPATTNVMGAEYPRVHADRSVTFRVEAPNARKVQVDLGRLWDMERDNEGVWGVTIRPQVPGFHYYFLAIDGVRVSDPASRSFYGVGRYSSGIEIPEAGVDYAEAKDVPHGEVRSRWYLSTVTGKWRRCFVYTPPDYDASPSRAVGLKTDGCSRPSPHSTPRNVFGPKWMKNVRSNRIHAVWLALGRVFAAFSTTPRRASPPW